jgi:multidrug transporter EmrE-like cation transporter
MALSALSLILFSVLITAGAQLLLKQGAMASIGTASWVTLGLGNRLLALILQPYVVAGLSLYGLGAVIWLFALARVDLSFAYPFVGLGFVLTMVLSYYLLGEPVATLRVVGTLMIAVGCVLVARSA